MQKASTVAKGALIISAGTLLSRLLGLIRENQLLNRFGDSDITGAYNVAFMVPDLLYYLLAGGALSAAFIPVFSSYLAKGKHEDANRTGSSIANLMLMALIVGVTLQLIFAPYLVRVVGVGFDPSDPAMRSVFDLTVSLTRVMCVMVIFTALSGMMTGILNSYHHFLAPTLVWNTYNLGIILGIAVLSKLPWRSGFLGIQTTDGTLGIYGVAFGVLIGALTMVLFQLPFVIKHGFRYSPIVDLAHDGVKNVLKLFAPVMVGLSLSQLNLQTIPLIIATTLGTPAVTDVRAANRLVMLPLGLFAVAISTAAFPRLAQQMALGEVQAFRDTVKNIVKAILLLSVPSSMAMFILAEPVTYLLWGGSGEFGQDGIRASAFALVFFAWGLLGISISQAIGRAFYSLQDTKTPVIIGIAMVAANIPLAFYLATQTPLKYGGVAAATTVTSIISSLVLIEVLRRRMNGIGARSILIMTAKVLAASILMGIGMFWTATKLAPTMVVREQVIKGVLMPGWVERVTPVPTIVRWPAPSIPKTKPEMGTTHKLPIPEIRHQLAVQVGASLVMGFFIYLFTLWLLRTEELSLITGRIAAKFRRRPPPDDQTQTAGPA